MSRGVTLFYTIYPRECVGQAIAAYTEVCRVEIGEETAESCLIRVEPLPNIEVDESKVAHEFLNYLLQLSLETHLGGLTQ